MDIVLVIPALNPDKTLLTLVGQLRRASSIPIVVVNDGSTPYYDNLFQTLDFQYGCVICRHPENRGKGAALKTGIREAVNRYPSCLGFVTADADGQHSAQDILRIATTLTALPGSLILGARSFSEGQAPFRSRWGNRVTSQVFRLLTGIRCGDTQTGLRGIPARFTRRCLEIGGDRYEYEMNVLMAAAREQVPLVEIPIKTIYLEGNRSSHFHPLLDSLRIYRNLLKFGLSSAASALVDLSIFTILVQGGWGGSPRGILAATAAARVFSGCLNFLLNKGWVFSHKQGGGTAAVKYLFLFSAQLLCSWLLVNLFSVLRLNLTVAKMLADSGLFLISYYLQKHFIFAGRTTGQRGVLLK